MASTSDQAGRFSKRRFYPEYSGNTEPVLCLKADKISSGLLFDIPPYRLHISVQT